MWEFSRKGFRQGGSEQFQFPVTFFRHGGIHLEIDVSEIADAQAGMKSYTGVDDHTKVLDVAGIELAEVIDALPLQHIGRRHAEIRKVVRQVTVERAAKDIAHLANDVEIVGLRHRLWRTVVDGRKVATRRGVQGEAHQSERTK